jgi:hypothetical protein
MTLKSSNAPVCHDTYLFCPTYHSVSLPFGFCRLTVLTCGSDQTKRPKCPCVYALSSLSCGRQAHCSTSSSLSRGQQASNTCTPVPLRFASCQSNRSKATLALFTGRFAYAPVQRPVFLGVRAPRAAPAPAARHGCLRRAAPPRCRAKLSTPRGTRSAPRRPRPTTRRVPPRDLPPAAPPHTVSLLSRGHDGPCAPIERPPPRERAKEAHGATHLLVGGLAGATHLHLHAHVDGRCREDRLRLRPRDGRRDGRPSPSPC